jgi:uncharacterized membrane protein YfcA
VTTAELGPALELLQQAPELPAVLGIIFFAIMVRAVFGFGDVLVSVPILALIIGPREAVPLMGLVGSTNALLILLRERRGVQWRPVRYLLMASVCGIPLGAWSLSVLPERWIAVGLGLVLIAYCGWALLGKQSLRLHSPRWAWPFGFAAGLMGGAVAATGPPIVVYSATQGWTPAQMRATMQGFFLPNGLLVIGSHLLGGLWTPRVLALYLLTLPLFALGLPLGARIGGKVSAPRFEQLTQLVLLGTGVLLLVSG